MSDKEVGNAFSIFIEFLMKEFDTNISGVSIELEVDRKSIDNWKEDYSRKCRKKPRHFYEKTFCKDGNEIKERICQFLDFISERGYRTPLVFQNGYDAKNSEYFQKFFESFLYGESYWTPVDTNKSIGVVSLVDLYKLGYTPKKIAERLMDNDARLYGEPAKERGTISDIDFSEANAGTIEQWAKYLSSWSDSFEYLINSSNEIVGNYSFLSLNDEQYFKFCEGVISEIDLKPSETRSLYQPDTSHIMLLLNLSVNSEYNTVTNSNMIRAMFWNKIAKFAQEGVIFKKIVVNVFRQDHESYYKSLGFKEKCKHKKGGKIFELEMIPYPQSLDEALAKNEMYFKANRIMQKAYAFICLQLRDGSMLTELQRADLAALIYKTDAYIYPCLFEDVGAASNILPSLIESQDEMFKKSNYYVAMLNGRIVGMILWHKGPLNWDNATLVDLIKRNNLPIPNGFDRVCNEYFGEYNKTGANVLSVINVCISEQFQGNGLGTLLMEKFCEKHASEKMELFVLEENRGAQCVYAKCGFKVTQAENGFSRDDIFLPCFKMEKK